MIKKVKDSRRSSAVAGVNRARATAVGKFRPSPRPRNEVQGERGGARKRQTHLDGNLSMLCVIESSREIGLNAK